MYIHYCTQDLIMNWIIIFLFLGWGRRGRWGGPWRVQLGTDAYIYISLPRYIR
jgi:hypothetical protein